MGGLAAASLVGAAAIGACGGSDTGGVTSDDAGAGTGTDATIGEGGNPEGAAPADAASDGALLADGGSNLDPDGGDDGDDAGPDGGRCNVINNTATSVTSTCISAIPTMAGGELVTGKYHLTAVAALGSATFCTTMFAPASIKETLDLAVGVSASLAETITEVAPGGSKRRTASMKPGAGNVTPMQITGICPTATPPAPTGYTAGTVAGKETLIIRLPYGKGEAIYTYEKQ